MHPLALAFSSGVAWGAADFLGGLSARRLPLLVVASVSQAAGFVFIALLVVVRGEGPPGTGPVTLGLLAGCAGAVGLTALYRGLAIGRMSVVAPTAALSGVVPVAWGLIRGDQPSSIQLAGIAIAIGGVALAARSSGDGSDRPAAAGVGLALVAALMLGILVVMLDEVGRSDALWGTLTVRMGALVLLGGAVVARRPPFAMTRRQGARLVVVGVLDNGANLSFALAAAAGGTLALTAVLGSLYPVTTVLLARTVLHERLARHQAIGVALALAGVAAIAWG
jgi:drug/metabolite transporter (DMT)-like permease